MNPATPAFQFYPDDFLAGVVELTPHEVGVYIRLLCIQWNRGSIPESVDRMALIAGGPVSPEVISKFVLDRDGRRRNARLEFVRQEQEEYREAQRQKGIKSGISRNQKRTELLQKTNHGSAGVPTGAEPETNRTPNRKATEWQPDPQPNTNPPPPSPSSIDLNTHTMLYTPENAKNEEAVCVREARFEFEQPKPDSTPLTRIPWLKDPKTNARFCGGFAKQLHRAYITGVPATTLKKAAELLFCSPKPPAGITDPEDWLDLLFESAKAVIEKALAERQPQFCLSRIRDAWSALVAEHT